MNEMTADGSGKVFTARAITAVVSSEPKWEIQAMDPLINAMHDTVKMDVRRW